jgi:hypothetical protein
MAKEISGYLEMPLSTVQVALKDLLKVAPRVWPVDRCREGKGRPEKTYSFQRFIPSTESVAWEGCSSHVKNASFSFDMKMKFKTLARVINLGSRRIT